MRARRRRGKWVELERSRSTYWWHTNSQSAARPASCWRVHQAGGPWPILRYEVNPIPEDLPPFGAVQDVAAEALDVIANLKTWFDITGRRILEQPSAQSLRRLLRLSTDMARHQSLDRLAEEISALEHQVPD